MPASSQLLIYIQTAVFVLALIYNCVLAYEASPRTTSWRHAVNILIFAGLLVYEIYLWPVWH